MEPSLLYQLVKTLKLSGQGWKSSSRGRRGLPLRRKLFLLQLKEGGSVSEHIKAMTEALAVIGDMVTEEDRVVYLLASLPCSNNNISDCTRNTIGKCSKIH